MAKGLAGHVVAMARNNAWANHRLLKACGQLSQDAFAARRTSFFPSIKATLNHILTVDWYYLEIFERSLVGLPPSENPARNSAGTTEAPTPMPIRAEPTRVSPVVGGTTPWITRIPAARLVMPNRVK